MEYVQQFIAQFLPSLREVAFWFLIVGCFVLAAATHRS